MAKNDLGLNGAVLNHWYNERLQPLAISEYGIIILWQWWF